MESQIVTSLLTAVETPTTSCDGAQRQVLRSHGVDFEDIDEKGDRRMRTIRRIRNAAFLGLVVALAWGGQVKLSADSGGYFACYGNCTVLWDCAGSVSSEYDFMEDGGACIRLVGCTPSEVTIDIDYPWAWNPLEYGTSPAYFDLELFDATIYPGGDLGCDFSLPIPEG
jgi:hypothetical protein